MMWIIGSLLGAWILNLFGFDNLVINGMLELFNLEITKTGYYFIFGIIGMIKFILHRPTGEVKEFPSWSKSKKEAEEAYNRKYGL